LTGFSNHVGDSYQDGDAQQDGDYDLNGEINVADQAYFNTDNNGGTVFQIEDDNGGVIASADATNGTFSVTNLEVANDATYLGDLAVTGHISSNEYVTAAQSPTANNHLTRKDYVDSEIIDAANSVAQLYSYDASTYMSGTDGGGSAPDVVYYLNGDVTLYQDSTVSDKSYLMTLKGANLNGTETVSIYAENNEWSLDVVDDNFNVDDAANEVTFRIGYNDINGLVDATNGVVRGNVVISGRNSGLTLFFHLVATP
jgi:hypothetical protein